MAFNWFSKKGKQEEGSPEEAASLTVDIAPTDTTEAATTDVAKPDAAKAEPSKAEPAPVESEAAPSVAPAAASPVEASATPETEAATGIPGESSDGADASEKKGFLRGAWEATKKLALTPVDPFFENMVAGLERTRKSLMGQLASVFRLHKKIDEDFWDELEDTLITSDVGTEATDRIMKDLAAHAKEHNLSKPPELTERLREVITEILLTDEEKRTLNIEPGRVNVILMVGVNGAGKTTSTAKLTQYFKSQGLTVLLAAADTFRAAAIEQLETWSKRLDVPLIRHKEGADPAAVVFDACSAAKARGTDILIIDTAGRLQNKSNLMKELEKIHRVIDREIPDAPHEVILVLDATTGQNALSQARQFSAVTPITGLVMCKLDGSARGGIMVAVAQEFGIPVKFIGVGEGVDDLRPFVPRLFIDALFGEAPVKAE